jgi:DnaJ-class molecular chaperone
MKKCRTCNGTGEIEELRSHFWGMGYSHGYEKKVCWRCKGSGEIND